MCEFLTLAHAHENKLPIVIGRLFNTSGPRQSPDYGMVLPRFVRQALSGEPITVYGDGTQSRCFVHVSDVVDAVTGLMQAPGVHGEIFNIGSAEETSIGMLAERVKTLTNSSSSLIFEPHERVFEGFVDMQRRVPDLSRIRASIGYEPRFGLDDIIRDVARTL
jgi:UDP-glucose 4-epimerase